MKQPETFYEGIHAARTLPKKPGCEGLCTAMAAWCRRSMSHERGRVMFAGNLAHGLEKAELERHGLFAQHGGRLHHFFGRLIFTLGVDDLGPPIVEKGLAAGADRPLPHQTESALHRLNCGCAT